MAGVDLSASTGNSRSSGNGGLIFRAATAADSDLLSDLVLGDPDQETTRVDMRLYGMRNLDEARKIFRAARRAGANWRTSKLALAGSNVAGMLETGHAPVRVSPMLLYVLLSTLGPMRTLRLPRRLKLDQRVSPRQPSDAYVVSELHVAPHMRGRGYGAAMLTHAERAARQGGFGKMALQALTTNPAQHLYARFGFVIVETVTDPVFRRITGADGNVLMVKHLAGMPPHARQGDSRL